MSRSRRLRVAVSVAVLAISASSCSHSRTAKRAPATTSTVLNLGAAGARYAAAAHDLDDVVATERSALARASDVPTLNHVYQTLADAYRKFDAALKAGKFPPNVQPHVDSLLQADGRLEVQLQAAALAKSATELHGFDTPIAQAATEAGSWSQVVRHDLGLAAGE